jgi:hypothetical protein
MLAAESAHLPTATGSKSALPLTLDQAGDLSRKAAAICALPAFYAPRDTLHLHLRVEL